MLPGSRFSSAVKERDAPRPFRVRVSGWSGIFVLTCAYLLYSTSPITAAHAFVGSVCSPWVRR